MDAADRYGRSDFILNNLDYLNCGLKPARLEMVPEFRMFEENSME